MRRKRTKRICSAMLAVLLAVSLVSGACASDRTQTSGSAEYQLSDYISNEVLAIYTDGTTEVFTYDTQAELRTAIETLSAQSSIVWIQPNFTYNNTGTAVDDPMYAEQWALSNDGTFELEEKENQYPVYDQPFQTPSAPGQWTNPNGGRMNPGGMSRQSSTGTASTITAVSGIDVNAEEAWGLYDGGSEVILALIDTGVDDTHEDLADSLWINDDEIAGNGVDDDGNSYIDDIYGWNFYDDSSEIYVGSDDDHGTHGAGTIVASSDNSTGIAGIAGDTDNVEIMVLKALGGPDGSGTTQDVIEAIQYAKANGASIVNLSLGTTTYDYALYLTMKNSGMLFVVAAGNDGADSDTTGTYPAAYDLDNIISVANLQCDGNLSSSSNYGETSVDIAAPGSYTLSTTTAGSYSYMTGTSMAAPMVTAVAALVYSYYDDISLSDVKQIILGSAGQLDALDGLVLTGGMLDAGAALCYDLSTLEDTETETETDMGSAPVITYETYTKNSMGYMTLTVTDADDNFCMLCYEKGEQTAAYFNYGLAGTQVTVDGNNSTTFRIVNGGTYTFYALDMRDNETIEIITVTAEEDSGTGNGTQDQTRPDNLPGGNGMPRMGRPPMNAPGSTIQGRSQSGRSY